MNKPSKYLIANYKDFLDRGLKALKEQKYYPALTSFNLAKRILTDIERRGGKVDSTYFKKLDKLLQKTQKKMDAATKGKGKKEKAPSFARLWPNDHRIKKSKPERKVDENKKVSLFLFGLDRAGKTTFVEYLKQGKFMNHSPTLGINVAHVVLGNVRFEFNDLGGQKAFRTNWMDYWKNPDMMIFMIDAADHQRFAEARDALWSIIDRKETRGKTLMILSNKIDLPEARSLEIIKKSLDIRNIKDRLVNIHEISIKEDFNLEKPLNFIASHVLTDEDMQNFVSDEINKIATNLKGVHDAFIAEAKILEKNKKYEKALNRLYKAKLVQEELLNNGFSKARKQITKCIEQMTRIEKMMNKSGIIPETKWWKEELS
ncbi:MAG: ADP-ribosylation factor-like protein [Promethearchaeota archaeon]